MSFRGLKDDGGKEALREILKNIGLLISAGVGVIINTVIHRANVSTLIEMYKCINNLGVRSWRVGFPKQAGFFRDIYPAEQLSLGTMLHACFDLLKYHLSNEKPLNLQVEYLYREKLLDDLQKLSDDAFTCDYEGHRESCCVKPNGDVVSCAYFNDFPLGNIRKRSLQEIWHSTKMQEVKRIFHSL